MAGTGKVKRVPPGGRVENGLPPRREEASWRGCPVVGIGASAGGLEALQQFFRNMPRDTGIAFVIVQHLDPERATLLPELVAAHTSMPVRQAEDQTAVGPNQVYVIPPNKALTIDGGTLRLAPLADAHRFAIDTFFRSLAEDQADNAACVILSGTGSDGTLGLREVKDRGGLVVVQTPETAAYDAMPRNAIATGLVDLVVPVTEMPARLVEYFKYVEDLRTSKEAQSIFEQTADRLGDVWALLARQTGHDFSHYKQGTIVRRIQRRMQMLQSPSVESYIDQLRTDPKEVERLYKELLIGVTQFFRDPEAFQALARDVIPKLFEHKDARNDVRIWVPGCATGEEAYTVAVLAVEYRDTLGLPIHIQIFGTDIDEEALRVARQGEYPEGIARQISPERLERFFVRKGNVYQATKEIREVCIFSPHHLIQDPPFSRLDLVSCRNVLIYLESGVQAKLLALFHYAIRPNGYLMLGSSENIGDQQDLFRVIDRKHRIFQRREDSAVRAATGFSLLEPRRPSRREPARMPLPREREERGPERTLERLLLEDYAPPGVVITAQGKIVFTSGRTGKYLELPPGTPTDNVADMAHKSLRPDLRTAIHKAVKSREAVTQHGSLVLDGTAQRVKISVRPLSELGPSAELFMVVFQDAAPPVESPPAAEPEAQAAEGPLVTRLRSELAATREHLQTTVEELGSSNAELKTTNEELVSMNEELQSANEELQSANEELQTSQEELQSLNEELGTVNAELRQKLEQLDVANSDLQNLFRSTEIATIFLSRDLRIKKFTPAATHLFRFRENDVGRPLADITARFADGNLVPDANEALRTLATKERVVQLGEERWYIMRVLPYRTVDDLIDGVVITFVDVSQLKRAEEAVRRSEQRIGHILGSITDCYYHLDQDWRVTELSYRALAFYGKRREEMLGRSLWEVFPVDVGTVIEERYRRAVRERSPEHFEVRSPVAGRWAEVHAYPVESGLSVYFRDITDRKEAEEALAAAKDRLALELAAMTRLHAISTRFVREGDVGAMLEAIVEAAISITGADMGNIQLLDVKSGELSIQAARGFGKPFLDYFSGVHTGDAVCGTALQRMERIVVEDVTKSSIFAGSPALDVLLTAGVRAVQSTPLLNRFGTVVGMLSTHYRTPRAPDERDLRLLDLLARQTADVIEQIRAVQALREGEARQRELARALRESAQNKDRFLAMLGHELRTPLAAIVHSTLLLERATSGKDGGSEDAAARREKSTAVISRQAKHLVRIVDDLLDISRIARGTIELRRGEVDLGGVVRRAIELAAPLLEEQRHRLEMDVPEEPLWLEADPTRLEQVVGNLLDNAAKYTDPGGQIRLSVAREGGEYVLRVRDNGMGIPPELLPRVFDIFVQSDHAADRSRGGLGLGLHLVRQIVEMHGGSVQAASDGVGTGTEIVVRLPALPAGQRVPSSASPEPKPEAPRAARPLDILVVEDNQDLADGVVELLRSRGHRVEVAHDGRTGIERALARPPDVVLLDIGLSEMDGYEIARRLREQLPKGTKTRLVALTGYGQDEDRRRAREAGFDLHLVKPLDVDELSTLLKG